MAQGPVFDEERRERRRRNKEELEYQIELRKDLERGLGTTDNEGPSK